MSNRTLPERAARTAAALGILGVTMAPLAFAGSASAAELPGLKYACSYEAEDGEIYDLDDPWTVTVSADLPETVRKGETLEAPQFKARITMGQDAVQVMRDSDYRVITEGGSLHFYTVGATEQTASVDFDLPATVPASGTMTVRGSGEGEELTPRSTGTLAVKVGDLVVVIADDEGESGIYCEPLPGQSLTLGKITVTSGATSSPTTKPTSTSSPTGTHSPTATGTHSPTGTGTHSPTGTASTDSSTTAPPTDGGPSGPRVDTGVVGDGGSNQAVAAGAAGVVGAFALTWAYARRALRD